MSKGKIDKNSSFFKNLENIYAAKSGVKKPHKDIKKHKPVEVPQQPVIQQPVIQQQVPQQQVYVPQQHMHIPQQMHVPQNIVINVLGQPQVQNNSYVKCPNCDYIFCNNSQNPFLEFMK